MLSIMEHHSNIVPWHFLRERQGAVLKWAPVDDDGNFLIDEFEKLLTPRTKLVAITHMSNALGTIVPVKEVVQLAHARGIPVLVDGSQGAVHLPGRRAGHRLRLLCLHRPQDLRPDRHRRALRQARAPRRHAAVQRRRRDDPRRLRATSSPMASRRTSSRPARRRSWRRSGWAPRSTTSIRSARTRIAAHEHDLLTYAQDRLREINSLRIIGTARNKGAIVSFEMKGAHPHDVATVIDRSGVAVRAGTHCVMPLSGTIRRHGDLPRVVRPCIIPSDEVDILAQALIKAQDMFA